MIRVLHVFHNMGNGGIEHYVMDRYRLINKDKIQFDFLMTSEDDGFFDDEIHDLGGKIFHTVSVSNNPVKCFFQIRKIVKDNNYQIVHRHTGNAIAYFDLLAAKSGGAHGLIIHSHNNSAEKLKLHNMAKKLLSIDCNRFACSNSAGKWLFDNKPFIVLNNAIDTSKYVFNQEKRAKLRERYGISQDAFVVGHIGRFDYQKNHTFLIDVFSEILKIKPESVLICAGDGPLKNEIEAKVKKLDIYEKIVFTGVINNVDEVINCFDVFCLPSNYEGFGITLIEAQANGLHCFASEGNVTNESNIAGNITYIPLKQSSMFWAKIICDKEYARDFSALQRIVSAGFEIKDSVLQLEKIYEELANEGHFV